MSLTCITYIPHDFREVALFYLKVRSNIDVTKFSKPALRRHRSYHIYKNIIFAVLIQILFGHGKTMTAMDIFLQLCDHFISCHFLSRITLFTICFLRHLLFVTCHPVTRHLLIAEQSHVVNLHNIHSPRLQRSRTLKEKLDTGNSLMLIDS